MQGGGSDNSMSAEISKSYNSETGILTVSLPECKFNNTSNGKVGVND